MHAKTILNSVLVTMAKSSIRKKIHTMNTVTVVWQAIVVNLSPLVTITILVVSITKSSWWLWIQRNGKICQIIQHTERKLSNIGLAWSHLTRFSIYRYATAFTKDATVIIGGRTYDRENGVGRYVTDIVQFKDGEWTKLGDLLQARGGLGAIDYQEETLIVGGGEDRE